MDKQAAIEELRTREPDFLTPAKKRVGGHTTYICPNCNNGSGKNGDGIVLIPGFGNDKVYKCFKCDIATNTIGWWRLHNKMSESEDAVGSLCIYYSIPIDEDDRTTKKGARKLRKNTTKTKNKRNTTPKAAAAEQEQKPPVQHPALAFPVDFKQAPKFRLISPPGEYEKAYFYRNGTVKVRYKGKDFRWQHLAVSKSGELEWKSGGGEAGKCLFIVRGINEKYESEIKQCEWHPEDNLVFLTEGEKDALNIARLGFNAASSPDGAGSGKKWLDSYTEELRGKNVVVCTDNDPIGVEFAQLVCGKLYGVANSVVLLDFSAEWEDMPEHADASDFIEQFGEVAFYNFYIKNISNFYTPPPRTWLDIVRKNDEQNDKTLSIYKVWLALQEDKVDIKYDVFTHHIILNGEVVSSFGKSKQRDDYLLQLFDKFQIAGYRHCKWSKFVDIIHMIAHQFPFNPIIEAITAEEWDGEDYLTMFYDILGIEDDDFSKLLFKKWCLQAVALWHNESDESDGEPEAKYSPDGILVLSGSQGVGKTLSVSALGIEKKWVTLSAVLKKDDKDTLIRITSRPIAELGELDATFKASDISYLKGFITRDMDRFRKPYGHEDSQNPRRTAIIGTVNEEKDGGYLVDRTGNRRFWTIHLEEDDTRLDKLLLFKDKKCALGLWRQIYHEWSQLDEKEKERCYRLTPKEQKQLETRNAPHKKPVKAQREIENILARANEEPDKYNWEYMTSSEFQGYHSSYIHKYTAEQIGRALNVLGFEPEQKRIGGVFGRYYYLPKCKEFGIHFD